MAPRFHLVSSELFINSIPQYGPTNEDCSKFKKTTLSRAMLEDAMYAELAAVVRSVLDAAGCDELRFLDAANHKAKDSFNYGGIYTNSPLAREATGFTDKHCDESTMAPEELETRFLGLRAWDWIDIPFQLKTSEKAAAFYFKSKPREYEDVAHVPTSSFAPVFDSDETAVSVAALEDAGAGASDCMPNAKPETTTRILPPIFRNSTKGNAALDQFLECMLNIRKCQHRTFSYAVYICYDMARLLHFDRSGALVSEPFRWDREGSPLHQFVWKIVKLASAGRVEDFGRDPTAKLVSGNLKDKFMALKDDTTLPAHVRDGFKKATTDNCPIYQLEVVSGEPSKDEWFPDEPFPTMKESSDPPTGQPLPEPSSSTPSSHVSSSSDPLSATPSTYTAPYPCTRRFLVGRPHFTTDELFGRCTMGYYAYDVTDTDEESWRVCFLKDLWRPVVPGRTRPEHLLYERFRRRGVTPGHGIGTLICGGDVGGRWGQKTRVQKHPSAKINQPVLVHYRIVVEEIGLCLKDFRSFPELSAIFSDVVRGHYMVWSMAKVLHRDVSVGNIMIRIRPNGAREGFLIDWDRARLECELGTGRVEPDRTGTWRFQSALSLRYPWKPYRVSDDIESFVHAYMYLVLRYHATDLASLSELVTTLFDGASCVQGVMIGGARKLALFQSVVLPFSIAANPHLESLLESIFVWCTASYNRVDLREMEHRYGFHHEEKKIQNAPVASPLVLDLDSEINLKRRPARHMPPCDSDSDDTLTNAILDLGSCAARRPHADEDPCVMSGILSIHGRLMGLFVDHANCGLAHIDKGVDQFIARRHQDVFQGPYTFNGDRGTRSRSMSETLTSDGHASCSRESCLSESDISLTGGKQGSTTNLGSGLSLPTGKTPSHCKKRARDEDTAGSEVEGHHELEEDSEPSEPQSAHLRKRVRAVTPNL